MKPFEFDYDEFQAKLAAIADVSDRELALLEDTVRFYNSKNRARTPGGYCVYYATENSPGCAIGRCIERSKINQFDTMYSVLRLIEEKFSLPSWLVAMDKIFLKNLQILHDDFTNWNDAGISETGMLFVEEIKQHINDLRIERAQKTIVDMPSGTA